MDTKKHIFTNLSCIHHDLLNVWYDIPLEGYKIKLIFINLTHI